MDLPRSQGRPRLRAVVSREEAQRRGSTRYFTGRPCKHGHLEERYTSSARCLECQRLERAANPSRDPARKRAWRAANPIDARVQKKKSDCRKKGVMFDEDAFREILRNTPTHCPVLGIELAPLGSVSGRTKPPNLAEVDRIDPARGYVSGNMEVISRRANVIKNDATSEELQAVASYYKNKMAKEAA